jgi:peroxiredoxin
VPDEEQHQMSDELPPIGQPAPPFTLTASIGGIIGLEDYRDKQPVVLAFYPLDFTGG